MSRPIERQEVILDLIKEVWQMPYNQDMRLGQLLENCGIGWNTEDVNEVIARICEFSGIAYDKWAIWGTRGIDGKSPLVYKKLIDLSSSHLEELLKVDYCKYKEEIRIILNERKGTI